MKKSTQPQTQPQPQNQPQPEAQPNPAQDQASQIDPNLAAAATKIVELTNDLQRTRADFENFRKQVDLQSLKL